MNEMAYRQAFRELVQARTIQRQAEQARLQETLDRWAAEDAEKAAAARPSDLFNADTVD